ncbi:YchF family ATPase [bacterium]|nr:YchF family ATPase [bacterium]
MKIGIMGLPMSGKATLFEALTQSPAQPEKKAENRLGTITVPELRIDILTKMYNPKKTIYAKIEYFLPGRNAQTDKPKNQSPWTAVRDCDALIHVVRNHNAAGLGTPDPLADFLKLENELIFADLIVAEKRMERIEKDRGRPTKASPEEEAIIIKVKEILEREEPLRHYPEIASDPLLRGFAFLSARPLMIVFNNGEDDDSMPEVGGLAQKERCFAIRAQLEHEITQMDDEDAKTFLEEYGITEPATHRAISESYDLLGLMPFFTVGPDEVRAWTIKKETIAVDAADVIHSDIKKGFIRAETIAYDDLIDAGNYAEARKRGTVRLEGKTYIVQDGDIIDFRFNV